MTRKQKHEGKQSSSRVPSDNRALVAIPTTIPVSRPADINKQHQAPSTSANSPPANPLQGSSTCISTSSSLAPPPPPQFQRTQYHPSPLKKTFTFPGTMPALPSLLFDLVPRDDIPNSIYARGHGAHTKPKTFSPGVLVVFSLIGASLALLVWWLFIQRSGFIWRESDWDDYKSSVLRRPEERPDDAITVFSDGTTRRGGGSSVGTRTVVLGELDTTYTKSMVERNEKPWIAPQGGHSLLGKLAPKAEGSIWGRLRGGARSEADTDVVREKMRYQKQHDIEEENETELSYADTEPVAPPLATLARSQTHNKRPMREQTREPSYAQGDDRAVRYSRPSGQRPQYSGGPQPKRIAASEHSESETDSDDYTDSDDEESMMGLSKGTKAYHHPIGKEEKFWKPRGAIEKGSHVGSAYDSSNVGSSSNVGRGYRAGSVGSLSSVGSVGSSNAGTRR